MYTVQIVFISHGRDYNVILEQGALYVVATPIGNLGDLSPRAIEVLRQVDHIAAEDTRHSGRLLQHFAIETPTLALHEHNERQISEKIIAGLRQGKRMALISDAGTPLVSDPGFFLVRAAIEAGIRVIPLPGPCALTAALSVAGLPPDRFHFEGFLPSKAGARESRLRHLEAETATLVFYEAPHRILDTLAAMGEVFGGSRQVVIARELTKTFETLLRGTLSQVLQQVHADANQRKGEMVILVHGAAPPDPHRISPEAERILDILLEDLPVRQAASLAARITGVKKNRLYERALDKRA